MTSNNRLRSWSFDWDFAQYREVKWAPKLEPRKRSLPFIASFATTQWHVTITFEGSLHSDKAVRVDRSQRRLDLRDLCLCLDFDRLKLLDNTVTELLIKREHDDTPPAFENHITSPSDVVPSTATPISDSEYYAVFKELRLCVQEDPFHIRYPTIDHTAYPTIALSEVTTIRQLCIGVHEVRVGSYELSYAYKQLDKPLYDPRDSHILSQELQNLQLFRGTEGIIQLVAAVVSCNPYHTFRDTSGDSDAYDSDQSEKSFETHQSEHIINAAPSNVLYGVLLEYHPNGTLADALQDAKNFSHLIEPRKQWPKQIAEALSSMHKRDITHMDLKPSNILISAEYRAVLSDISGIGGVTREYLAPEMLDILDPLAEDTQTRILNDIWALGKMFLEMADTTSDKVEKEELKEIARIAMADEPSLRPSLVEIIAML